MSLRLRLTLFYSAFFAIILSAVAVSVYLLTERSLNTSLEQRARQTLRDLADVRASVDEATARVPGDAILQIYLYGAADLRPTSVELLRLQGDNLPLRGNRSVVSLLPRVTDAALEDLIASGTLAETVTLDTGRKLRVFGTFGEVQVQGQFSSRSGALPPEPVRGILSAVYLVAFPSDAVIGTLNELARTLGLTVMLAFVAFAVGVFLLSRQVLAPVQRVTQASARVTGRELSQRVPVPRSNDEMRELAVTINHMLDRLQESFETQRRFTADASHELRTPVTAIVGHTNYLLRRTRPNPEQVDSLTVIRREAERMAKLVNDLLELARADAGFTIEMEPMNLVDVVEAVHMEVAPMAGAAEVVVDLPQPLVEVRGDAGRLKQVVLNLVQNALNAGATRVTIGAYRERDGVRLEILDNGPGIPADAIPHLFDRFYRVDGARSTRGNGSGLGLAIVRWIVQQHGGSVSVESRLGEGSVFTVMLPSFDSEPLDTADRQTLSDTLGMLRDPGARARKARDDAPTEPRGEARGEPRAEPRAEGRRVGRADDRKP